EVDLGPGEIAERNLVDQHGRAITGDDEVIGRLLALDVELVLEAGAAAALHADAQHGARRLAAQDRADLPRRPFGHVHVAHGLRPMISPRYLSARWAAVNRPTRGAGETYACAAWDRLSNGGTNLIASPIISPAAPSL